MNIPLTIAAAIFLLLGIAHSYLGERYILIRLFRRHDLPKLFGSDVFTRRTLRMAWHLTTVTCLGFAALLLAVAATGTSGPSPRLIGLIIAGTSLAGTVVAGVGTRGRHLSWLGLLRSPSSYGSAPNEQRSHALTAVTA